MSRYVVGFDALGRNDIAVVGGKGANLGELTRAGLPVPSGFVVTAEAYLAAMDRGGVREELHAALDAALVVALNRPAELTGACDRLQELVGKAGVTEEIRDAVLDAYHSLGPDVRVAVRSSATSEDTAGTSFAGMHATFTNVAGDDVMKRLQDCWVSLFGPRVVAYRASRQIEVIELARLALHVEQHYGAAQDLEWAIAEGRTWLVQSRPITTLEGSPGESQGMVLISGLPASPGRAAGRVRVLSAPSEGERFANSEVLVAKMTNPDWVPTMRRAAALVTDGGGMTAHAAIVAPILNTCWPAAATTSPSLMLGVDRDSEICAELFDESDPAVLDAIARIIRSCAEAWIMSSLCGPIDDVLSSFPN